VHWDAAECLDSFATTLSSARSAMAQVGINQAAKIIVD
jgi:hypothetical protein